jgi:hypothetical protein
MPRYRHPPLTLAEIQQPGPPVRIRDLVAITGLRHDAIYEDIAAGRLIGRRRMGFGHYYLHREDARVWLRAMGFMSGSSGPTGVMQSHGAA